MVLIVSAAAATAALTGIAVRSATDKRVATTADLVSARLIARSGIEAALQVIAEDGSWRTDFGVNETFSYAIHPGSADVLITDETDGDLSDDTDDPYTLTSVANVNDAKATLRVTVTPKASTYRERVLAAGPIRYWPLDETSGFTADDLTGNQNAGHTNPGALGDLTGYDGGPAALMDSAADFSFVPHSPDYLLDQGTIMCWVYCSGDATGDQTILAKTRGANQQGDFILTMKWGSLDLFVTFDDGDSISYDEKSLGAITPAKWTHVAITFGDDVRGFVDGVEQSKSGAKKTNTASWGTAGGAAPGNSHGFQFGAAYKSIVPSESVNGSVRDVIIFDSQLTENEIAAFLNAENADVAADTIIPEDWAWIVN